MVPRTRNWFGCVLVTACFAIPLPALAEHEAVNFSFFFPLATNHNDPGASATVRIGVIYGRLGSVEAFDLTGVVARTDGDVRGGQIVGIHSYTTGAMRGASVVGGVNLLHGDGRGAQVAGLVNFDRDAFTGAQFAGVFNFTSGPADGMQFASIYNLCDQDVRGVQIAGVANMVAGGFMGAQVSGINFAGRESRGAQVGYANYATGISGAQVGLINLAGTARGTQVGFWNVARQRMDGVPVGAVNVAGNGAFGGVAYASTLVGASAGLYTEVNGWTSMFTAGIGDWHDEQASTGSLAWHYGHTLGAAAGWDLGADLGFVHLFPHPSDDPAVNDRLHFAIQPRLTAVRPLGRLHLLAGAGLSVIWSEYSSRATADVAPLALAGVIFE